MQVSSWMFLRVKKHHIKEHEVNNCGSWWYIEVLWSETISLCKKPNVTVFTVLLPVIQSFRPMVQSDVRFANEPFFWTGYFWWTIRTSSSTRTGVSETVCGSSSTDLKVTQTPASHYMKSFEVILKYAKIVSFLILGCWFCQLIRRSSSSNSHCLTYMFYGFSLFM